MANKIDFKNMSIPEGEFVLSEIDTCLKIASEYNGSVFGGYIRDVIVPRPWVLQLISSSKPKVEHPDVQDKKQLLETFNASIEVIRAMFIKLLDSK